MMNRQSLIQDLIHYKSPFEEEKEFARRLFDLLQEKDCFERTHLPGHITGSAWIVNPDNTQALLVHHAKLNRWLQPGGHCDGEEDVLNVALREANEETGVHTFIKILPLIYDLDIHLIPERKDFPAHFHYDIRFLFYADETTPLTVSEESHDVAWISLDRLESFTTERSVLRMREKLFRGNKH